MLRFQISCGLIIFLTLTARVSAEFTHLEPIAAKLAEKIAEDLKGRTVVVAARSQTPVPWPIHEAIAVELTAALQTRRINVIRSATHPATKSLSSDSSLFTSRDAKRVKTAERDVLCGVYVTPANPVRIDVTLWQANGHGPISRAQATCSLANANLEANVPSRNRDVVKFCQKNLGDAVGDGICATLAKEALQAANAERTGIYTWGREMDGQEPIMPGDILQLELVKLKGNRFSRSYHHHTAVVETVRPDYITVLHQNVAPKGKVVQRDTWPTNVTREGIVQAFRPWNGKSPLPAVSPRRRTSAQVIHRAGKIDLLHTLDPRADSVRGIWFWEGGGLRWNRDSYARLQIPYAPPKAYTLNLKIRRLVGADSFGIGLIVAGRQTLLAIDGYGGTFTGLNLLDGKKCKDNESTYRGTVLPADQVVDLIVRVRPDSVLLKADEKTIVDWQGDPARLSMQDEYAVPRTDWLFLTSWNTHCEISEFTLTED